jgi:hypothetical protein
MTDGQNGNQEFPILDELAQPNFAFENWNNWFAGVEPAELSTNINGVPMNGHMPMNGVDNGMSGQMGFMDGMPPNADLSQLQMPGWRP